MNKKYFTYSNFKVELNREELMLVPEFARLAEKDFNKCKEDKSGKECIMLKRIFEYIFFMTDLKSPYKEEAEGERLKIVLKACCLTLSDINKQEVKNAFIKYESLTKTRLQKMLESAHNAVDQFTIYFNTVDYTKIDPVTGKPVFNIKDGMAAVATMGKLIDGVKLLEEQVAKELENGDDVTRGNVKKGMFD